MATQTTHYSLVKPAYEDQADVGVLNGDLDQIDELIYDANNDVRPVTKGGTGGATVAAARANLGLSLVDISSGVGITFNDATLFSLSAPIEAYRFGNVVQVYIAIRSSREIAQSVFTNVGTFTGLPAPVTEIHTPTVHSSASYQYHPVGRLSKTLQFSIRVFESAMRASNNGFAFTYLCEN